ncbi:lasso peptide biosynthesis B2 protein [Streptomyces sp. NPDC050560]|uniref:lasso peptide biosynthesis B2 protein n=1 Tax=Streptomyces sp. NPDC050560 TaxID=3365630 RepID=UPI00379F05BE
MSSGPSWGAIETPAVLPLVGTVPVAWRVAALPALLVTATVRLVGTRRRRFARLVRLGCYGRGLKPATHSQAEYAVRAIRWASRAFPARWGCLEQSTAAAALLVGLGRRAEWRHGIALDPIRLHAWIADHEGQPIEEPPETTLYTTICTPDSPGPPRRGPRGATL